MKYVETEWSDRATNLGDFDPSRTYGPYDMPTLEAVRHVPEGLLSFDEMTSRKGKRLTNYGVHFFINDVRFEGFWKHPGLYLDRLALYDCVLTPDYSILSEMPTAMKIWNAYRNRLLGQMCRDYGITTIPTLTWAGPDTYDYCFGGIEPGGTVAVSTVGCMRCGEEARKAWADGMNEAVRRLKPTEILLYGHKRVPDFDAGGARIVRFDAWKFDKEAKKWAEEDDDPSRTNLRS